MKLPLPKPPRQAVILCGGRGTRLGPATEQFPKPMAPILGKPFLEYLLNQLRRVGCSQMVLLTGYLGEQISSYFGDGQRFGLKIEYSHGPLEWETGRRLWEARTLLDPAFLLLYGDNFTPFRPGPLVRRHEMLQPAITLTASPKARGNIRLDSEGRVIQYDSTRAAPGLSHVEIGYMLVERAPVLSVLESSQGSFSLVLEQLAKERQLAAVEHHDAYQSISDPERWRQAEEYFRPKRLILLDRDGVLNRKAPRWEYVSKQEEVQWIPETLEGLQELARQGFEFVVLSNQAGIGRGVVQRSSVDELHAWMTEELAQRGIVLRDFFICPHHWDEGCSCRKPSPGLFFEASRKHQFRLDQTLYVGDDARDVQAAARAGCPCLLLGSSEDLEKLDDAEGYFPGEVPAHAVPSLPAGLPWIEERFCDWEVGALKSEAVA